MSALSTETFLSPAIFGAPGGYNTQYHWQQSGCGSPGVGGGVVILQAASIIVEQTIDASGGAGSINGGGGGGGTVVLVGNSVQLGNGLVTAKGGAGGCSDGYCARAGGRGRILIRASTITGTTDPPYERF